MEPENGCVFAGNDRDVGEVLVAQRSCAIRKIRSNETLYVLVKNNK